MTLPDHAVVLAMRRLVPTLGSPVKGRSPRSLPYGATIAQEGRIAGLPLHHQFKQFLCSGFRKRVIDDGIGSKKKPSPLNMPANSAIVTKLARRSGE